MRLVSNQLAAFLTQMHFKQGQNQVYIFACMISFLCFPYSIERDNKKGQNFTKGSLCIQKEINERLVIWKQEGKISSFVLIVA